MKELVEVIAKALVDNPDEVVVTEPKVLHEVSKTLFYRKKCAPQHSKLPGDWLFGYKEKYGRKVKSRRYFLYPRYQGGS